MLSEIHFFMETTPEGIGQKIEVSKVVRMRNQVADEFQTRVIPEQRRIIERLTVGTFREKAGEKLSEQIEQAFSAQPTFSNKRTKDLATRIRNKFDRAGCERVDVREVQFRDNREKIKSLIVIKDDSEPGLVRTQVLETPTGIAQFLSNNTLNLVHYFFTQTSDGRTADLIDLVPDNSKVKFSFSNYPSTVGYIFGNRSIIYDEETLSTSLGGSVLSPGLLAHESGHALQYYTSGFFYRFKIAWLSGLVLDFGLRPSDRIVAQKVVDERNAEAFALAVIKKYRNLGLDLFPRISNASLRERINEGLEWYNRVFPNPDIQFTKK